MPGTADLMEGHKALDNAAARYLEAATYYEGTPLERFANAHIQRLVAGSGDYRFRLAHRPVNTMANRTRIAAITSDREEATARIDVIRQANDMAIQEGFIHRRTFLYGDAYVLVWPVDEEEPGPAPDGEQVDIPTDDQLREAGVEITYQSPLACRTLYDGEDGRRPRYNIRRWRESTPLGTTVWRAELLYPDRVEEWVTLPDSKGGTAEEWLPYAEDEDGTSVPALEGVNWPLAHDWGEIPVKHARTDLPYGKPEHVDAYGPQDAVNKVMITQLTGVEAYGWPDRWRLLSDQAVLEQARENVVWDDDAEAPAASNLRPVSKAGTRTGGGQEHVFTGTDSVGEYSQPDPRAMVEPVDQYLRLMAAATETALAEFDPQASRILSGEARREADRPTRDKELDRKLYLEGFWREVWTLALAMDGTESGVISVQWAPGEVNTDPEWWTTAQTRLAMGVPLRQILLEANYLPDEVEQWLKGDSSEEAALDQRIARLTALGTALQGIGTAQALGVVSPEQVAALVNQIMGQAGVPEGVPTEITPPPPPVPPGQEDEDPDAEDEDEAAEDKA